MLANPYPAPSKNSFTQSRALSGVTAAATSTPMSIARPISRRAVRRVALAVGLQRDHPLVGDVEQLNGGSPAANSSTSGTSGTSAFRRLMRLGAGRPAGPRR